MIACCKGQINGGEGRGEGCRWCPVTNKRRKNNLKRF